MGSTNPHLDVLHPFGSTPLPVLVTRTAGMREAEQPDLRILGGLLAHYARHLAQVMTYFRKLTSLKKEKEIFIVHLF